MRRRDWNAARRKATTDTTQGTLLASSADSAESRSDQLGAISERLPGGSEPESAAARLCCSVGRVARATSCTATPGYSAGICSPIYSKERREPVIDARRAYRNADGGSVGVRSAAPTRSILTISAARLTSATSASRNSPIPNQPHRLHAAGRRHTEASRGPGGEDRGLGRLSSGSNGVPRSVPGPRAVRSQPGGVVPPLRRLLTASLGQWFHGRAHQRGDTLRA